MSEKRGCNCGRAVKPAKKGEVAPEPVIVPDEGDEAARIRERYDGGKVYVPLKRMTSAERAAALLARLRGQHAAGR